MINGMRVALSAATAVVVLTQAVALVLLIMLRSPGRRQLVRIGGEGLVLAGLLWLGSVDLSSRRLLSTMVLVALLLWLLRVLWLIVLRGRSLRTSVSVMSIKEGMDALSSGLLFFAEDGHILLINHTMQELLREITGMQPSNGNHITAQLGSGVHEVEGRVWIFTQTQLPIKKKRYTQLTAADVTQQWSLTQELREKKTQLEQRSEELRVAFDNLDTVCRAQESLWLRTRLHDVLGQRVTLLLRALREQQPPDAWLSAFAGNLSDVMRGGRDTAAAAHRLQSLQELMGEIGVALDVTGGLPKDADAANLIADIIMECATNAVRHGFATTITAAIEPGTLRVCNNGSLPEQAVVPGHGIRGMEEKLAAAGGRLNIQATTPFTVIATMPVEQGGTMP